MPAADLPPQKGALKSSPRCLPDLLRTRLDQPLPR
jgi:hypothetical protein